MESDPYLALAADSRKYGSVHTRRIRGNVQEEILIEAVAQFKRAIEEAKMQVLSNQELSLTLSNELRLKQRLLDEEQKTTDKLIQDKKDLIMKLAESRERIIQLENRLKKLEDKDETPPPLPPKSSKPAPGPEKESTVINDNTPPELPKKTRKPSTMIQRKKKLP